MMSFRVNPTHVYFAIMDEADKRGIPRKPSTP